MRDLCVRGLLADRYNAEAIDCLLASSGYQRLLPEAVLQEVGLFASRHVDNLMARILAEARPNRVHGEIAARFPLIFTTNFDSCFERADAQKVVHLHGAIDDPHSLQNRVFRLGKERDQDIHCFESNLQGRPLVVVGYSLRDEDVIESITRARPDPILYLSHDGDIPPYLSNSPAPSFAAKGSAEELFSVRVPAGSSGESLREISIRRPPIGARASALLFLVYLSGLYELAPKVLDLYLPRLTGRTRYKAICSVADSMRILGRYTEAIELCERVMRSRFCRRPDQVDQLATVNNLVALCELDSGEGGYERAKFHFRQALDCVQRYKAGYLNSSNAIGIEIFRARITNNLGIVYSNRGEYQRAIAAYTLSREVKAAHHDDRGIAQTDSNLAKCYLKMGDHYRASQSLREVVRRMTKAPDRYICKDAVDEMFPLMFEVAGLTVSVAEPRGEAADETWARLESGIAPGNFDASRILRDLRELERLRQEVYKG
jgi:tetratricopeptide (TPR) repeat protein